MSWLPPLTKRLEALLLVAGEPIPASRLAEVTESAAAAVQEALDFLSEELKQRTSGIRIAKMAGGYRLVTAPECAPDIERFLDTVDTKRLSPAALETLAIIAYRQPVTRREISTVRGVSVDGVVASLEQRGLIRDVGREETPGNPILYGTTQHFLERLGLTSLADLPQLEEFEPDAQAQADIVASVTK